MDEQSRSAYLQTEVMTATPQRLRLMLIEGALRFASLAQEHWQAGRDQAAIQSLAKCRAILAELLGTIQGDQSNVAARVRDLYVFLLQTTLEIGPSRDVDGLANLIGLLQMERETWKQVCFQMPEAPTGHRFGKLPEVTAANSAPIPSASTPRVDPVAAPHESGGFCLDA
jgi:flagellar protein FliS